jgi:hypothetical protein
MLVCIQGISKKQINKKQMNDSNLFSLGWKDAAKGLLMA